MRGRDAMGPGFGRLLDSGFLASLNHLLRGAEWARVRLQPHAGRSARLDLGPLHLPFRVEADGLLGPCSGGHPDLVLELPPAALTRLVDGPEAVMRAAGLRGNVEFAEAIGFVFRNLRWDVEEDLSRVTGDVAARRLVRAGSATAGAIVDTARRFGENLSDYLRHEAELSVPPERISRFCREVDELRDDEQRLEARLRRLEASV